MYEFSLDCVLGFLLFSIVCLYPSKLFLRMYLGSFGMLCHPLYSRCRICKAPPGMKAKEKGKKEKKK